MLSIILPPYFQIQYPLFFDFFPVFDLQRNPFNLKRKNAARNRINISYDIFHPFNLLLPQVPELLFLPLLSIHETYPNASLKAVLPSVNHFLFLHLLWNILSVSKQRFLVDNYNFEKINVYFSLITSRGILKNTSIKTSITLFPIIAITYPQTSQK